MKKKFFTLLTLLSFTFAQSGSAHEETFYYDEDEEYFNQGTVVGQDTGEYERAVRRTKMRNWTVAVGSVALGITTLVLVGKNHK